MKSFFLKVFLFFACVVVMDILFGKVFLYLRAHAKGGSTANCEYIANSANEDIIILGSSRATHHYIPQIIEDSLGVTCYNCGEEGNGIVLAYGRLIMLTNRYKPQLVIYELTPSYDYEKTESNSKYLGYLRPYYEVNGIRGIFDDFDDELSSLKMNSSMYRNTGKLLPNLVDNIIKRDNQKGFAPLYGRMSIISRNSSAKNKNEVDSLKLSYMERMIVDARRNHIPLIFMVSPCYNTDNYYIDLEPALSLCEKYGISLYNYIDYKPISDHLDYFQDEEHLNVDGAIAYTNIIIEEVLDSLINGK